MKRKRVAVVGATGYTGSELVRLLNAHPEVEIAAITSRSRAGQPFSSVHGAALGITDQELVTTADLAQMDLDAVFLALPHGASMAFVADQQPGGPVIIDLSGDFRLPDADIYARWYGQPHAAADRLDEAVFGLPELFRDRIAAARLVANPGCYPTATILALAPLIRRGLVAGGDVVVDAKSGVTGAGATAKAATHFPDLFGDFKAYAVGSHRHTPEIETVLSGLGSEPVQVLFQPHLLPIDRGILVTCYARPAAGLTATVLREAYAEDYASEPFVRWRDEPPAVKQVRGSNYCDVHAHLDERTGRVIVLSVIDNLVKGAAGQAIQNLNIMFDWPETAGLTQGPLSP